MENIIYLAHGNNDLDHYLPILHRLDGDDQYTQTLLYIYDKDKVLTNTLHKTIMDELSVNHVSLYALAAHQTILKLCLNVQNYCKYKIESLKTKKAAGFNIYSTIFLQSINILIQHTLNSIKAVLFPPSIFSAIIENNSISLVIVDTLQISEDHAQIDLLSFALYYMLKAAKKKSVPIFMISHGTTIRYSASYDKGNSSGQIFPDRLALCNEMEVKVHTKLQGKDTVTEALGDLRFDIQWISKLENTAQNIVLNNKSENRFVILYIVANLTFIKNVDVVNDIHKDIFKLTDNFEDIEIWVKAHPRYPQMNFSMENDRIKLFFNDVDTNILLTKADLVLSPLSGILFQTIIQGKRTLYYDKWREYISEDTWTVFDDTQCVYRASNYEQLKSGVSELRNNPTLKRFDVEEFYMNIVSGGTPINKRIVTNYTNTIERVIIQG